MEQPEGCVDPDEPDFVCKLQKSPVWVKASAKAMVRKTSQLPYPVSALSKFAVRSLPLRLQQRREEGSDIVLREQSSLGL